MKQKFTPLTYVFLLSAFATILMAGCKPAATEQPVAEDSLQLLEETDTKPVVSWQSVIDEYLTNEIGSRFELNNVIIIPTYTIIAVDSSAGDVYRVWGDWWVAAYSDWKETLLTSIETCVPGLIVLQKTEDGFKVTEFDQVEEGRAIEENAKRVFGKYCDAFWKVNRDEEYRNSLRLDAVSQYVHKHDLHFTKLQLNDIDPVVNLK